MSDLTRILRECGGDVALSAANKIDELEAELKDQLTPAAGFFFGATDYNKEDWEYQDKKHSTQLTKPSIVSTQGKKYTTQAGGNKK